MASLDCNTNTQDVATVVSRTMWGPVTGTSTSVPIPPTVAGDLLVVAVSWNGIADVTTGAPFATVNASGRALGPWLVWDGPNACGSSTVLWVANNIIGGAAAVAVEMMPAGNYSSFTVAVFEVSGVEALLSDPFMFGGSSTSAATATAPAVHACPGQLVVSTIAACGALSSIAPGSPFTALGAITNDDAAFFVPTAPGAYGAEWSYGGGSWSATTLLFRRVGDPLP